MQEVLHFLTMRTWWIYDPGAAWYAQPYHWINLVEGCFWLGFVFAVFKRYATHRHTPLELLYALAFLTFGL